MTIQKARKILERHKLLNKPMSLQQMASIAEAIMKDILRKGNNNANVS